MPPRRPAVVLAALALAAAIAGAASPEEGTAPRREARADFNIRFAEPVRLAPTVRGEARSTAPARYTAQVRVLMGGAIGSPDLRPILTLRPWRGSSDDTWRPLDVRFTLAQRRTIRAEARRQRRRPVLSVRLSGTLEGAERASAHLRQFIMSVR